MFGKILKITYYVSITITIIIVLIYYYQSASAEFLTGSSQNIQEWVKEFYDWAIKICIGLAVIMLMYSGYLYVTSAGNTEQIGRAKEYIISALSGLVFLILAGLIFGTLKSST